MLARPLCWRVAQTGDPDPARQPAIDGSSDQVGREEREGYGHVDLPQAAFLALRDALRIRRRLRDKFVEPTSPSRDGCDQGGTGFGPDGPRVLRLDRVWQEKLTGCL